MFMTDVLP